MFKVLGYLINFFRTFLDKIAETSAQYNRAFSCVLAVDSIRTLNLQAQSSDEGHFRCSFCDC